MAIPQRQLYINGQWTRPSTGNVLPVINPATETKIGVIPAGSPKDIELAVQAAVNAFKNTEWRKSTGAYRAAFLRKIAQRITEDKQRLATFETLDQGKPIAESEADMDDVIGCFNYYATLAEEMDAQLEVPVDVGMDDFRTRVRKEAMGAVGLITPWNYPLLMAAWKVAPALAAGNTVVLKPSEMASVTCLELAAICHELNLPPGVLNVVTGLGADTGAVLSAHPALAKVAFTGSTETGRRVARAAAENLVPATMELGGKSALIVFDDADLANAVEWCMTGVFFNVGQVCSATSRLLVQEGIAPRFLALLKQRTESIKVGDPMDPATRAGAIVSQSQYEKVMAYIQEGKRAGAPLLTGGGRPPHLPRGHFVQPTVFTGVTPNMRIWKEEIFGPVLSVATFRTEEEAIRIANDTLYGLAGAVCSSDPQRCDRVAKGMEVGIMWINCSQPTFVQAPWGGVKASGHGRELGPWGLSNFTSLKQITSYTSSNVWDWYPGATPSKL